MYGTQVIRFYMLLVVWTKKEFDPLFQLLNLHGGKKISGVFPRRLSINTGEGSKETGIYR